MQLFLSVSGLKNRQGKPRTGSHRLIMTCGVHLVVLFWLPLAWIQRREWSNPADDLSFYQNFVFLLQPASQRMARKAAGVCQSGLPSTDTSGHATPRPHTSTTGFPAIDLWVSLRPVTRPASAGRLPQAR